MRNLLLAAAFVIACAGKSSTAPLPAGGHHVLFVGNSLTYVNDLPGTLAALAASVHDTIRVQSVTQADFALIDHLSAGQVQGVIAQRGWEYVILQQGPSTLPVNRDSLVLWTRMFDTLIRAAGARTALYEVWPGNTRLSFFPDCLLAYQTAAQAVGGVLMAGGQAWQTAWAADPALQLYGSDGFHPSPLGTYLVALVMYEKITGHDARNLPGQAVVAGSALSASVTTVRLLQSAAHQTNLYYR